LVVGGNIYNVCIACKYVTSSQEQSLAQNNREFGNTIGIKQTEDELETNFGQA